MKRRLGILALCVCALAAVAQDAARVIPLLTQTVDWYRAQQSDTQSTDASEITIANESHALADQVLRASFDFARASADAAAKNRAAAAAALAGEEQAPEASQYQRMMQLAAKADAEVKRLEGEIETSRRKLEGATGKPRDNLQALLAETQSELDLAKARRDALHSMSDFLASTSGNGQGNSGFRAQIEALARTVPGVVGKAPAATATPAPITAPAAPPPYRSEPTGIWSLTVDAISLERRLRALRAAIESTEALQQSAQDLQTPMASRLIELTRRGDELAKAADSAGQSTLEKYRKELDGLTTAFKQTAAVSLPLSKQIVLLGVYERSLASWETSLRARSQQERRRLLLDAATLALTILVLFGLSALARRMILRYVLDVRRRAQLLMMRRVILWFVIALIVGFSFAGEIGSVATFAGLLSAGIALALQNVLVAVAGYFFLTGKYGIRVGDRVQIAGVNGEVVEIGLVRLHLMEMGGGGIDTPTGRIVAFSNSIVFQPGSPIFKRIPGTSFRWHEMILTLSAENDFTKVKERLQQTMDKLFTDYDDDMTRQSLRIQETFSAAEARELRPRIRLRFTDAGLEAAIRYPADSPDMDERVSQELLKAVETEPKLQTSGPASANLKLRTDLSAS